MSTNTPPPNTNANGNDNSTPTNSSSLPRTPKSGNKNRTCRNVIIHGYCKYEHSGCEFNHDLSTNRPSPGSPEVKSKLRVDSPIFNPSSFRTMDSLSMNPATTYSPQNPYYPPPVDSTYLGDINTSYGYYGNQPAFIPPMNAMNGYGYNGAGGMPAIPPLNNINNYYLSAQIQDPTRQMDSPISPILPLNTKIAPSQPLQYHLYTSPLLPHMSSTQNQRTIHSFFIPDKLREELQKRNEAITHVLNSDSPEYQNFPKELHIYHSFNIIKESEKSTKTFGYPTSVYKSISSVDGKAYALRRVEGYRLANEMAMKSIENWRRINHSNIVSLKEAFTTKAFGDHSLIFVYDYYPLSVTLESKYLTSSTQGNEMPESTLWSIIIQITSALKAIHSAGLAARTLKPSKILVTDKNRIRLNCCGMFDLLKYDGGKNYLHYQQEDLLHFGQLIVSLACGSNVAIQNLSSSIDYISRHHSLDLKSVILYLLSKPSPMKNIDDILSMTGSRVLQELDNTNHYVDYLQNELSRELENGRLVRLLCKLGTINERPEFDMDPTWSETGDRYLLKLFRDYTFHQVDENGKPFIDIAHIIQCLNKLDVGIDEKIMLMSRDEQSCLIVSYKELKNYIVQAIQDLRK